MSTFTVNAKWHLNSLIQHEDIITCFFKFISIQEVAGVSLSRKKQKKQKKKQLHIPKDTGFHHTGLSIIIKKYPVSIPPPPALVNRTDSG